MDDYNNSVKTIEEVKERFPGYNGEFSFMPFFNVVEKFKKEEYADLCRGANFHRHRELLTPEKLKELEEIAYARAVYHFCWGWENAIEQSMVHFGLQGKAAGMRAVSVVEFMKKKKKDPFARDRETVGKFIEQFMCRKNYEFFTDEEALRDDESSGDYY